MNSLSIYPKNDELYFDKELERYINQQHLEILNYAKHLGKSFGLQNRPLLENDRLLYYTENLLLRYHQLKLHVEKSLQPEMQKAKGLAVASEIQSENNDMAQELFDTEQKRDNAINQLGAPVSFPVKLIIGLLIALVIIWADATFTAKSFQSLSDSYLQSILFAMATIVSLAVIEKYLVIRIFPLKLSSLNEWIKRGLIASFIVMVSILRVKYFELACNCEVNSWFIIAIGFLFLTGLYLTANKLITPFFAQAKQNRQYNKQKQIINRLDNECKKLKLALRGNKISTNLNLGLKANKIDYCRMLIEKIGNYCLQSISAFKEANRFTRTDNAYPSCFDDKINISSFNPFNDDKL